MKLIFALFVSVFAQGANADTERLGFMPRIEAVFGTPVAILTGDASGQVPVTFGLVRSTATGLLPSWDVGFGGEDAVCIVSLSPLTEGFIAEGWTIPTPLFCTMEGWDGFTGVQFSGY